MPQQEASPFRKTYADRLEDISREMLKDSESVAGTLLLLQLGCPNDPGVKNICVDIRQIKIAMTKVAQDCLALSVAMQQGEKPNPYVENTDRDTPGAVLNNIIGGMMRRSQGDDQPGENS